MAKNKSVEINELKEQVDFLNAQLAAVTKNALECKQELTDARHEANVEKGRAYTLDNKVKRLEQELKSALSDRETFRENTNVLAAEIGVLNVVLNRLLPPGEWEKETLKVQQPGNQRLQWQPPGWGER